jgi:glycosyltransferase involved in cell wall biosynthesis
MGLKICVFPNDPLLAYYRKGEVKERYFNPLNIFDQVHVISLSDEEVEEDKVKTMAGNAKFVIHTVGKITLLKMRTSKGRVLRLVKDIKPDIIRSYNPLIQGWLATYCSKKMNIPLVVSVHTHYDKWREILKKKDRKGYYKLSYTAKSIEPYVLQNADKVICVYGILVPYAKKYGAKDVEVIYNRVYLDQFSQTNEKALTLDKPVIISVGRLDEQKNQECLIRAIQGLDVYLVVIGDGELYDYLVDLSKQLGVDGNVIFVRSVPHSQIHKYYSSGNIFALAMKYGVESIPIPILEALASGLPVVIPKPDSGREEAIDDVVTFVDNTPESFREAFTKLLSNSALMAELEKKGVEKARQLNGSLMEEREALLYKDLLGSKKSS